MSKILITGGAGFIGYNLVNSIKKSHEIVIFDNEFRGSFGKFDDNKIKFIKGDITKFSDWEKIPLEIDSVFHLGAINGTKCKAGCPAMTAGPHRHPTGRTT